MQQNSCSRERPWTASWRNPAGCGGAGSGVSAPRAARPAPCCSPGRARGLGGRRLPSRLPRPRSRSSAPWHREGGAPRLEQCGPDLGGRRRRTRAPGPGCEPGLRAPSACHPPGPGLRGPHCPAYSPPAFQCEEVGMSLEPVWPSLCPATDERRRGGRTPWPRFWRPAAPRLSWPGEYVSG